MSKSNVRLQLSFEFDLTVPDPLGGLDQAQLCKLLAETLGATVLQGLPAISAKQLGKAGIRVDGCHHRLDARNAAATPVPPAMLAACGPHLTDQELAELARKVAGRVFPSDDAMQKTVRRMALALVSDYRLVPCKVEGLGSSGRPVVLEARLNLTNGSILVGERDRQQRLQPGQPPLSIEVEGVAERFRAGFAGQTLSGPVLAVDTAELAPARAALVALWQRQ